MNDASQSYEIFWVVFEARELSWTSRYFSSVWYKDIWMVD
jgi:hypothetical protein